MLEPHLPLEHGRQTLPRPRRASPHACVVGSGQQRRTHAAAWSRGSWLQLLVKPIQKRETACRSSCRSIQHKINVHPPRVSWDRRGCFSSSSARRLLGMTSVEQRLISAGKVRASGYHLGEATRQVVIGRYVNVCFYHGCRPSSRVTSARPPATRRRVRVS